MTVCYFSLMIGFIYMLIGLLGFFPSFVTPSQSAPPEIMNLVGTGTTAGFGYLFGILPVTTYANIFNLIVGVIGFAGFIGTEQGARIFSDTLAVLFGLFTFLGLFPVTNALFGLMPLFDGNVWLHLATGVLAAYFGFVRDNGRLQNDPDKALIVEDPYGNTQLL